MTDILKNLNVITYKDEFGINKFEIRGFNPDKSSSISFEKIDPKYGEVIDVINEKELELVLGEYSYKNVVSTKEEVAEIKQAYLKAKENNFLNVSVYEANGTNYTTLSMKKDGDYYRAVLGDDRDTFLVNGRQMKDKEKFSLFYEAQKALGEAGMQKFGLVSYRNAIIDGSHKTIVDGAKGTVMDNALNPVHYLGAECAVRAYGN